MCEVIITQSMAWKGKCLKTTIRSDGSQQKKSNNGELIFMTVIIQTNDIVKKYGEVTAVDHVDLSVKAWPQWLRQDHDDQDADRADPANRWHVNSARD
jgi:hypothetical protein